MWSATLFLLGLGLISAIMLAIASRVFYVWEDPRIEKVEDALLGANCGGCGYAGCSAAAEAVVFGKAGADVCVAGGFEIALGVAGVMGLTVEEKAPEISHPGCTYGPEKADLKYTYSGVTDCRAAMLLYGGSKECNIGCLGLSTCVNACPFDALSMGDEGLPVVNADKCTSCGVCAEICPKSIITVTSATKRILEDQKVSMCTAPCQRNCPAEIDIPEYIRRISDRDYPAALAVIKEKNPFPLICGWLCPAPCEHECRRNLIDQPVAINALKKFVANYEMNQGKHIMPDYLPPDSGQKVAIVGGGVQGLTAAYYLRRLGHKPTIIEATEKFGGILRYVITEDRLPRDVLDWEIEGILETGVEARTGKSIGKDFSLGSLWDEDMDIVLLTTGGWDSRQIMRGKVRDEAVIPGTQLMLDFLYAVDNNHTVVVGKQTVILGGGKTAEKVAQMCLERGAETVTVVYPQTKKEILVLHLPVIDTEQIKYVFSAVPVELNGDGDALTGIAVETHQYHTEVLRFPVDSLIVGAGRFPEMLFARTEEKKWKTIDISDALVKETANGIFAVGDSGRPTDLARVVTAVGRGRKIARALHLFSRDEDVLHEEGVITNEKQVQNVFKIPNPRSMQNFRGPVENVMNLDEEESLRHAERCMSCGLICYRKQINKGV